MSALPFRRIVIHCEQGKVAVERLRWVAGIASVCQLELVGRYVSDPNLTRILEHPVSREYRIQERCWCAIERHIIKEELGSIVEIYRRSFIQALQSVPVSSRFEVGNVLGDSIDKYHVTDEELLVVCEPEDPLEQFGRPFSAMIDLALASANTVMVVPRCSLKTSGPVVIVNDGTEKAPPLDAAAQIAQSLGERMVAITIGQGPAAFRDLGLRLRQIGPLLVIVLRSALGGHEAEKLRYLANAGGSPVLVLMHLMGGSGDLEADVAEPDSLPLPS